MNVVGTRHPGAGRRTAASGSKAPTVNAAADAAAALHALTTSFSSMIEFGRQMRGDGIVIGELDSDPLRCFGLQAFSFVEAGELM